MKIASLMILIAVCFFSSAFAQDAATKAALEAACGPYKTTFDVKQNVTAHPTPEPEQGKALIYVVEDLGQCAQCAADNRASFTNVSNALIKIGMDGVWLGADQGDSYLFAAVNPGEHHLCINWQSQLEIRSQAFAMAGLNAEAGKTYYFRARAFPGQSDYLFDLDLANTDEGKYLVALSAFADSHPKK
jgi:hypothetical protein